MGTITYLPETSALSEGLNLSPEQLDRAKNIFQSHLLSPDIRARVEDALSKMENGTQRTLLMATLRRMENLELGAEKIRDSIHSNLARLLTRVESNSNQIA